MKKVLTSEDQLESQDPLIKQKEDLHQVRMLMAFMAGTASSALPFLPAFKFKERKKKVFTSEDAECLKRAEEKRLRKSNKRVLKRDEHENTK
jgi:hypothetical protein